MTVARFLGIIGSDVPFSVDAVVEGSIPVRVVPRSAEPTPRLRRAGHAAHIDESHPPLWLGLRKRFRPRSRPCSADPGPARPLPPLCLTRSDDRPASIGCGAFSLPHAPAKQLASGWANRRRRGTIPDAAILYLSSGRPMDDTHADPPFEDEEAPQAATGVIRHYFVDEAGDGNIFNRRKEIVIGREGCSVYFILGLLDVADPDRLEADVTRLRAELLADPYLAKIPSMQPGQRKTAFAFHAKDDCPEVRREVFRMLMQHDLRFFALVRDKRVIVQKVREFNAQRPEYRYQPNQLYDRCVSRLFRDRLHKDAGYAVYFSKRGNRSRTAGVQACPGAGPGELPAQVQSRVNGSDRDSAGNARQDRGAAGRGLFSLGAAARLRAGRGTLLGIRGRQSQPRPRRGRHAEPRLRRILHQAKSADGRQVRKKRAGNIGPRGSHGVKPNFVPSYHILYTLAATVATSFARSDCGDAGVVERLPCVNCFRK